jgi:hypothetical protein
MALRARFPHLLRSSSPPYSLHFASRSLHRRQASQLASPAPFAPVPLRQELNTLTA